MIIPTIVGPIMAGIIFDTTGTYDLAFVITLGFLAIALAGFALASPPASAASRGSSGGPGEPRGSGESAASVR